MTLMDEVLFEMDFEEIELGWIEGREENPPQGSKLGPVAG